MVRLDFMINKSSFWNAHMLDAQVWIFLFIWHTTLLLAQICSHFVIIYCISRENKDTNQLMGGMVV